MSRVAEIFNDAATNNEKKMIFLLLLHELTADGNKLHETLVNV